MLTGSLERRRGVLELPALEMKLTREAQRAAPGLRAAALLGEQDRLLDQGRRTIELQTRDVDARQLVRGLALEVLPAGLARELEPFEHQPLFLLQVALRPGDARARPQRTEPPFQVVGLEHRESLVDHLLGGLDVGAA